MELRVVTLDNRPDNPGHALADESFNVDTTDRDAVLEVAESLGVRGVMAPCTDVAAPTAAHVARRLGLAGPPLDAMQVLCDKSAFSNWLIERGLGRPGARIVGVGEDVDGTSGGHVFPLIVKPARSSGGRGASIVNDPSQLEAAVDAACHAGHGDVLIEQFIEGHQLTIEGFLVAGRLAAFLVTDRLVAAPPHVATRGHLTPSSIGAEQAACLSSMVAEMLVSIGVADGPFDADVIWDGNRLWYLEVSPRLGGNGLTDLWPLATGIDIVEQAIRYAMGMPDTIRVDATGGPAGLAILGLRSDGVMPWAEVDVHTVRGLCGVEQLDLDYAPEDLGQAFKSGRDRLGMVMVTGEDRREVEVRIAEATSHLGLPGDLKS